MEEACVKLAFSSAPILEIADLYHLFILECKYSEFALVAALSQAFPKDNLLQPAAYLSQSPIKAERDYTTFDKELLAIVPSFKEWGHYLEVNPH